MDILGSTGPQIVAPNSFLQNLGTVNGSIVVGPSEMIVVSSVLNIVPPKAYFPQLGSLQSFGGSVVLNQFASVQVALNLYLDGGGGLSVSSGHSLIIGNALVMENSAPLQVNFGVVPFNVSQLTMIVANYSRVVGTFGSVSVTPTRRRSVAVTQGSFTCIATLGQPVANYGSSSLSVTVSVSNVCTDSNGGGLPSGSPSSSSSSELSPGAIAGIAIGAVVGGVVVALAVVLITKILVAKYTASANAAIHMANVEQLDKRAV